MQGAGPVARHGAAVARLRQPQQCLQKTQCPERFCRWRHKLENLFCHMKGWRRIVNPYNQLARNILAATRLVAGLYCNKLVIQIFVAREVGPTQESIPQRAMDYRI